MESRRAYTHVFKAIVHTANDGFGVWLIGGWVETLGLQGEEVGGHL